MQQKLSTILLLLLVSTISGQARADYSWTYVAVSCDTARKEVTIRPSLLWNDYPTLAWHGTIRPERSKGDRQTFRVTSAIEYGECVLFPGTLVRVKVSEGSTRPYGMCGADPEIWLSLWVGKYHWIKQRKIGGAALPLQHQASWYPRKESNGAQLRLMRSVSNLPAQTRTASSFQLPGCLGSAI